MRPSSSRDHVFCCSSCPRGFRRPSRLLLLTARECFRPVLFLLLHLLQVSPVLLQLRLRLLMLLRDRDQTLPKAVDGISTGPDARHGNRSEVLCIHSKCKMRAGMSALDRDTARRNVRIRGQTWRERRDITSSRLGSRQQVVGERVAFSLTDLNTV